MAYDIIFWNVQTPNLDMQTYNRGGRVIKYISDIIKSVKPDLFVLCEVCIPSHFSRTLSKHIDSLHKGYFVKTITSVDQINTRPPGATDNEYRNSYLAIYKDKKMAITDTYCGPPITRKYKHTKYLVSARPIVMCKFPTGQTVAVRHFISSHQAWFQLSNMLKRNDIDCIMGDININYIKKLNSLKKLIKKNVLLQRNFLNVVTNTPKWEIVPPSYKTHYTIKLDQQFPAKQYHTLDYSFVKSSVIQSHGGIHIPNPNASDNSLKWRHFHSFILTQSEHKLSDHTPIGLTIDANNSNKTYSKYFPISTTYKKKFY